MSVYEKIKLDMARRNLEMEQELEKRRRNFDTVFSKIVPRLENYFNKECDSLIRDGGRANVASVLESPVRSITTFTFALPYDGLQATPSHMYRVIVEADRLCVAIGNVTGKLADSPANPPMNPPMSPAANLPEKPAEKPVEKPQGAPAESKSAARKPAVHDELGSIDAPDFLIKLDKSLAKMLELVMST
jgi:hypothetical protein